MEWKKPKHNDLRIRRGFLFLPKHIYAERSVRWLEFAAWAEEWSEVDCRWCAQRWMPYETKLVYRAGGEIGSL